nr:MAG TPA: Sporulation protein Cse60 [Caudoviricetes sp.]
MQREGYEILDIKFNSIPNQGMTGNRTGFNTLITYR